VLLVQTTSEDDFMHVLLPACLQLNLSIQLCYKLYVFS
jgi:hypothetical protein